MSDQIEIEEYDCEIRLLTEEEQRQMEDLDAKRRKAAIPLYEVAPMSADVAPVKHGHWIKSGYVFGETAWICSECGFSEWRTSNSRMKFCMNCGARMDGEQDE